MIRFASPNWSRDLGMSDPEDTWPKPEYNPGPPKHLHALGVISLCYNSFEAGLARLYNYHLKRRGLPDELTRIYYFGLDEQRRLRAINSVFGEYEKDDAVKDVVRSIINYFEW